MGRERGEEAGQDTAAVPTPVEREVHPRVGVPLGRPSGEVRRVREHPLEPSEAAGEVGPYHLHLEPTLPARGPDRPQGVRVQVCRDDPASARRGGREGGDAGARADLQHGAAPAPPRDPLEELGILPRGIDRTRFAAAAPARTVRRGVGGGQGDAL